MYCLGARRNLKMIFAFDFIAFLPDHENLKCALLILNIQVVMIGNTHQKVLADDSLHFDIALSNLFIECFDPDAVLSLEGDEMTGGREF